MLRRVALAGLMIVTVTGCGRGMTVRDRILASHSPLIGEAFSSDDGQFFPASVHVALLPDTTDEQAEAFWCDVVVPAGGTFDASGVQVTLAIQGDAYFIQEDWTCQSV